VGPAASGKRSLARALLQGLEKKEKEGGEEEIEEEEEEDEELLLPVAASATLSESVRVLISCASSGSSSVLPALRSCYARALEADSSPRRGRKKRDSSSASSPLFDVALFLLPPHARPGPRDRAAFRALSELVPMVPVLAKADAMTARELEVTQRAVRRALFGGGASGGGGGMSFGSVVGSGEAPFPFSREALAAAGFEVNGFGASAARLVVPVVCGARVLEGGGGGGIGVSSSSSSSSSTFQQQQHPNSRLRQLRALLLGTGVSGMLSASSARFEDFREEELLAAARRRGRRSRGGEENDDGGGFAELSRRRRHRHVVGGARAVEQKGSFLGRAIGVGHGKQQQQQQQQQEAESRRRRHGRDFSSSSSPSSSSPSDSEEGAFHRATGHRYRVQRSSSKPASFWSKLFTPLGRAFGFPGERRTNGETVAVVTRAALARVLLSGLSGYLLIVLGSSDGRNDFRDRVSADWGALLDRTVKAGALKSERAAGRGVERAAAAAEGIAARAAERAHAARVNAHAHAVGERSATEQVAAKAGGRAFAAGEPLKARGPFGRWISGGGS